KSRHRVHLAECLGQLLAPWPPDAHVECPQHILLRAALYRQQKWKAEGLPVPGIQPLETRKFAERQSIETGAVLLAGRCIADARTRAEVGMRPQQRELLRLACPLNDRRHRGMQIVDRSERPPFPRA